MSDDSQITERLVTEGAREAAQWALMLLDQQVTDARTLFERLSSYPPEKRYALLIGLVNLTGRMGVRSRDVATLKVALRHMANNPLPGEEPIS